MFTELQQRQKQLCKKNTEQTITDAELVELIGVNEILDSINYETELHMQGMIHELDQAIDVECQRLDHGGH